MIGMAVMLTAASAGMAHGELENGKSRSVPNYSLGVCQVSRSDSGAEIRPTYDGDSYLGRYHDGDPRYRGFGFDSDGTKVTLLNAPKHGEVYLVDTPLGKAHSWYHYMPTEGYVGEDRFVMQVERDGIKVRIQYLIEGLDKREPSVGVCEPDHWKISSRTIGDKPRFPA
jgi:hypothetical protein